MNLDFFQNDPKLKNMDPKKLEFLMNFANNQSPSGDAKDMASVLMSAASTAKNNGVEFSPDETDLMVEMLKQNMSPAEQKKADQIMMMMKTMRRRR